MLPYVYKNRSGVGFGNILIHLSEICDSCQLLHDNVYDWELTNCVTLTGFTRVGYDDWSQPDTPIIINEYKMVNVHSKICKFVKPTPYMQVMIQQHMHLLDGVSACVHIRRGSYSLDSTQLKGEHGKNPQLYHCSDKCLENFEKIIEDENGKVYVASDSNEVKQRLVSKFGNKLCMIDTKFACTAVQDSTDTQTVKTLQDVYLEWFLMSMCPKLYLTGGDNNFVGFSTYGYTAAVYGQKPFKILQSDHTGKQQISIQKQNS